ncbi:MAG: hypothetical protein ACK4IY_02220, partial [Chitinophagales bacterium]
MQNSAHSYFNYNQQAWRQYKKNKPAYFALYVLAFLAMVAVCAPLIANEKPLYAK